MEPITHQEIRLALRKMKSVPGSDTVESLLLLDDSSDDLIFSAVWLNEAILGQFLTNVIVPFLNRISLWTKLQNYRPIFLLQICSEMLSASTHRDFHSLVLKLVSVDSFNTKVAATVTCSSWTIDATSASKLSTGVNRTATRSSLYHLCRKALYLPCVKHRQLAPTG